MTDLNISVSIFDVPYSELILNKDMVLSAMNYNPKTKENVPELLCDTLDSMLVELEEHINIKAGYRLFPPENVQFDKGSFKIGTKTFQSGNIITPQIIKAESVAIFVATLGQEFDDWIQSIQIYRNIFDAYVADTIGSELIEVTVNWLEEKLSEEICVMNFGHSNRFSPGYCTWQLIDQHLLFSLLPVNFLEIKLNESALMLPRKSLSGIYGIGKLMQKMEYQCSICNDTDCYKRFK